MRLIDANALRKEAEKTLNEAKSMDMTYACFIQGFINSIDKQPTVIGFGCGELDHETMGKIQYMDLRPRMTEDKLNEITSRVCDIFRHTEFYDCTFCDKGMGGDCIECEEEHTVYFLLDVIASLHNELYKQVKGKYYDYMFHWANHGYGGDPDDSMFKPEKEVK